MVELLLAFDYLDYIDRIVNHPNINRANLLIIRKVFKIKIAIPNSISSFLYPNFAFSIKSNNFLDSHMPNLAEKLNIRSPDVFQIFCNVDLVLFHIFRSRTEVLVS